MGGVKKDNSEPDTKKLLEEINSLKIICEQVRTGQVECLKSQDFLAKDYDAVKKDQKSILSKLKAVEDKVDKLAKACEEKDKIISKLQRRVISLENHSRRRNIEVHGVTELEDEDVAGIVVKVASKLGVTLKPQEIEAAHRVPTRAEGKPSPIIAELTTRSKREKIIAIKNKQINCSDIVNSEDKNRVFVYAQISPELKALRWQAKQKAISSKWQFVWIRDFTLYARKSEKDRKIVKIECEQDLDKIC